MLDDGPSDGTPDASEALGDGEISLAALSVKAKLSFARGRVRSLADFLSKHLLLESDSGDGDSEAQGGGSELRHEPGAAPGSQAIGYHVSVLGEESEHEASSATPPACSSLRA